MQSTRIVMAFVVIAFFFSACSPQPTPDSAATSAAAQSLAVVKTQAIEETSIAMTAAVPTATAMPTQTPTPTATSTPTETAIPASATPLPTLSTAEREALGIRLLTEDLCPLPCWGGIVPGKTTWAEAEAYLRTFTKIYSGDVFHSIEISDLDVTRSITFYVPKERVDFIFARRRRTTISNIFEQYGRPDNVYIFIKWMQPIDTENDYDVFLYYQEAGFFVRFIGATEKGRNLSLCLTDQQGQPITKADLWLFPPNIDDDFGSLVKKLWKFSFGLSDHYDYYYPLEELSSVTVDDFYQMFLETGNRQPCVEVRNPHPPD